MTQPPKQEEVRIGVFEEYDPKIAQQILKEKGPFDLVVYLVRCGRDDEAIHVMKKLLPGEAGTLTDGVLISGPNKDGRCIIGVGGRRYDVLSQVNPPPPLDVWIPGREVWVDSNSMILLSLRETYIQGDVAQVVEVIDPAGNDQPTGKESAPEVQASREGQSESLHRLLLRVSHRQEEIVVEAVPSLVKKEPAAGDTVRIIPTLGIALELLTRGRGDLMLGEVPNVEYADIGGLDPVIAQIQEAIEEPLVFPTVFQNYHLQRPRGILLYGPPGCGKTMIAKAIANNLSRQIENMLRQVKEALDAYLVLDKEIREAGKQSAEQGEKKIELEKFLRNRGISPAQAQSELQKISLALEQGGRSYFVSIKGPELLSKWVGETESSIRGIFAMARERASFYTPVVLFFDELESMFSRRGSGISSDVQKTIVPQLLAEIDGVEETRNIIIIGASNRFDLIDPAVLRPGRLDFKIKIPRPDRNAAYLILARYLNVDVPFPSRQIIEELSKEFQQVLGPVACSQTSLDASLAAALDQFLANTVNVQAALFLTDLYTGNRPPAKKLTLRASSGMTAEDLGSMPNTWAKEDGLGWKVVKAGKFMADIQGEKEQQRRVYACPLFSPGSSLVVYGVMICSYPESQKWPNAEERIQDLSRALANLLEVRGNISDRLKERVLNILYHPSSSLVITELVTAARAKQRSKEPRSMKKKVEEIASGAVLESIVSRAKRLAVRREIAQQRQSGQPARESELTEKAQQSVEKLSGGVHWHDLYAAIRQECEEGKDQYVYELYADDPFGRDQAYRDTENFHVDVQLPPEDVDVLTFTWLVNKRRSWHKSEPVMAEAAPRE